MQVKEILKDCLKKLGIPDFTEKETLTPEEDALKNRLINCLNLIYQEIVSDYFFLTFEEEITLNGDIFKYSDLSKRLIKPLKLVLDGKSIEFTVLPSGIKCEKFGEAVFSYNYLPESLDFDSLIEDYRLTSGLLSNGVLGEYYFLDSVFDLASSYDSKFRSDLSWAASKGREIKVKARRWQ